MLFANIDILDENLDHKRGMFVGIEGSHVTYVGAEEPADTARFGERYDGTGKLLMSAFYNTHAHTPMTLLRGYAENQPLQQWLNDTVWPFEGKMDMEKKHHYWGCMLSQAEMLRYGVVGYTDMYFATIDRCEATLEAGMKANHCDGGTMCFVETDYDTLPVAAVNEQLFAEYQNAGDGRVKIDMCVHGEYTTPQGMIERCVAEAKAHDTGLHIHLAETKLECDECKERHDGMTPAAWFDYLGAFDIPVTAAHCVWVEPSDIELMAANDTSGVPVVNEDDKLVGFISDGDVASYLGSNNISLLDSTLNIYRFEDDSALTSRLVDLLNLDVMDIATKRVISVREDTPLDKAVHTLSEKRIKKMPVIDGEGRLVGAPSRRHVMHAIAGAIGELKAQN